jgi:hypothetical protein
MIQVDKHLQPLLHEVVGLASLDVDHETDATGVMLEPRIVKALLRGGRPCQRAWKGTDSVVWFVIGPTSLCRLTP